MTHWQRAPIFLLIGLSQDPSVQFSHFGGDDTEINEEAWASLYNDTSRPFNEPKYGCIAVKVINHLANEGMKVFGVD
ncbi:hypothetical protein [Nostoc sp. FACHB-133]|uniref:hypothetical protein n=1 Tax=Nostoc sp. FACHB-133 TaxID=2692835 RepID=UPI00168317FC|nr:hypothetical protein [Nostoc sp. FACHB-133]MBD2527381.1 hypothetical protein [Nostoc sp. FACHB-133]